MTISSPFIQQLIARCQVKPGCVVFPEGHDPRVVDASRLLLKWNVVSAITLLDTTNSASTIGQDTRVQIRPCHDEELLKLTTARFNRYLESKNRVANAEQVKLIASNPLYQAGALLDAGFVDCAVGGCVATTADVIRAALSTVGLATGIRSISGSFIMDRSHLPSSEVYVYGDCGVIVDPTEEQAVDIALGCAQTMEKICGVKPVIAFLSFSTNGSADHQSPQKMRAAAKKFSQLYPNIAADGEIQFDAAIDPEIAQRKYPGNALHGKANCFIFPDLNAGNIAYKISQRLSGFGAFGPILQGLARPYSDLSRGATADDIAISAVINLIRA